MINDLTTNSTLSSIWKFADDTTVSEIVPKSTTPQSRKIIPEKSTYADDTTRQVACQFFLVSPRDHFVCPVPSFSEMKKIRRRKVLGFQKNW